MTDYERWRMRTFGWIPEYPIHILEDDAPKDTKLTEYINEYETSLWMYEYIKEDKIPDSDYIVYAFDC